VRAGFSEIRRGRHRVLCEHDGEMAEFINQSRNSELIQQDFSALSYVQNCMLVTSESLTIHT
jgi:hypothetical protein